MDNSLYFLFDTNNGYNDNYLIFISFVAILISIFVIITKNPVISVLFLIILFLCVASYLILLGISFIGLSYLLVYVGAVSILFLFILMLINVRVSELQAETNNTLPLAIIIGLCFYTILSEIYPFKSDKKSYQLILDIFNNQGEPRDNKSEVTYVTSSTWDGSLAEASHITSIGNILYTNYFLWLIMTSIILLLAMVGTIIITIRPISK